ncbi:uncharacterized protein SAPINGB_P001581 [Magnusiomyces paraingens]|uniref:Uncharacterized protein n=1 Tax=Magnusiomyces paraingens TaxID=2606893 RepID=A0A5E8B6P1_9ASCO|nr:uncharacterized protein SAPINGB_P001581 [Saprochaete ingens]VVT47177.1 unnamed protein product [Saprochaete ingens]
MPRLRLSSGSSNKPLLADRLRLYDEHEARVQQALELVRSGSSVASAERRVGTSSKTISMRLSSRRNSIRSALELQRANKTRVTKTTKSSTSSTSSSSTRKRRASSMDDSYKTFLLTTSDPTKLHLTFDEELCIAHHMRLMIDRNGPFPYQLISEILRYYVRLRDAFQHLLLVEEAEEAVLDDDDDDDDDNGDDDLQIISSSCERSPPFATPSPSTPVKRVNNHVALPPSPQAPPSPPISSVPMLSPASSARASPALPPSPSRRYSILFSSHEPSDVKDLHDSAIPDGSTSKPSIISITPSYLTNFCKRNGIQSRTLAALCKETNFHDQFCISKETFIRSKIGVYSKLRQHLVKFEFVQQQQHLTAPPNSELARLWDADPQLYDQMLNNISTGRVLRLCFLDPAFSPETGSGGNSNSNSNNLLNDKDRPRAHQNKPKTHGFEDAGAFKLSVLSRILDHLDGHPVRANGNSVPMSIFSTPDLISVMFDHLSQHL